MWLLKMLLVRVWAEAMHLLRYYMPISGVCKCIALKGFEIDTFRLPLFFAGPDKALRYADYAMHSLLFAFVRFDADFRILDRWSSLTFDEYLLHFVSLFSSLFFCLFAHDLMSRSWGFFCSHCFFYFVKWLWPINRMAEVRFYHNTSLIEWQKWTVVF